jgi:DNA-binding GntR family transcriptional regulator
MPSSRAPATAAAAPRPAAADVAERTRLLYEGIVDGVKELRLAPGARLREERLGALFEVSRTQVRKVLHRLELEGVVRREPNRGATVAAPDAEETREIFDARRLIEPWVVTRLCERCSGRGALGLRRIVRDERRARDAGDRRAEVRLSGEFHRALAAAAGNRAIAKSMDELTLRTCLAVLANSAPTVVTCRDDEHERIVDAIERGDARQAARLMTAHLDHIEASMDAPGPQTGVEGLDALFEELSAPAARKPRSRAHDD